MDRHALLLTCIPQLQRTRPSRTFHPRKTLEYANFFEKFTAFYSDWRMESAVSMSPYLKHLQFFCMSPLNISFLTICGQLVGFPRYRDKIWAQWSRNLYVHYFWLFYAVHFCFVSSSDGLADPTILPGKTTVFTRLYIRRKSLVYPSLPSVVLSLHNRHNLRSNFFLLKFTLGSVN
jgi:hypothetical protein